MLELRLWAFNTWLKNSYQDKIACFNLDNNLNANIKDFSDIDTSKVFDKLHIQAGQPDIEIVTHTNVPKRSIHHDQGKSAMLHALAHIEFNAINLALDAIWRFENMPTNYYLDWFKVCAEEAKHFYLLNEYLKGLNTEYGKLPAHSGLWDMAIKTKDNLIARLAMVPRTLEARGLDMAPVLYEKLIQAKDNKGADILTIILHDELEHVLIGNKWYEYLCNKNNLNPVITYANLILEYDAPSPSKPVNQLGRFNAGFYLQEIKMLCEKLGVEYEL
ncbi:MAG: hypothetical protein RLZZ210_1666 [Pseudomonadota bacterium]|jgi:uncharacterized ferritin-like protein (DUF455 family)